MSNNEVVESHITSNNVTTSSTTNNICECIDAHSALHLHHKHGNSVFYTDNIKSDFFPLMRTENENSANNNEKKEEDPYSFVTSSMDNTLEDPYSYVTNKGEITDNLEESSYPILRRASDSILNSRPPISRLRRRRLNTNQEENNQNVIYAGDSMIGLKGGIPGFYSPYRLQKIESKKTESVGRTSISTSIVDKSPYRPPRRRKNKEPFKIAKIYDQVFEEEAGEKVEMRRRSTQNISHVILSSGEQRFETGVRMYDVKAGRPARPISTVVLPMSMNDDDSDSAESWDSEFGEESGEKHHVTEEEFYEVLGKPVVRMESVDNDYEKLETLEFKTRKELPKPPLPPRQSMVFQNLHNDPDKDTYVAVDIDDKSQFLAHLPPLSNAADNIQIKRYQIIKCIIENEKAYMKALRRLIKDYEEPLLERNIISLDRVTVIFKHVHEIIQSHQLFNMALADRIAEWESNDVIGDLLYGSFSRSIVLKAYSSFIYNFSFAMDSIKETCKLVPAFLTFLKRRRGFYSYYYAMKKTAQNQLNHHSTKQSLYDLMRQPLERIPQLVLLTQELTHITPISHPDHFSLQMALTQLECLSETLSEKKRDALLKHKVRQLDAYSIGLQKPLSSKNRYYIRHDDMLWCKVKDGEVVKNKLRRLFLLNDLLICTKTNKTTALSGKKFRIDWCVPIHDVEVVDIGSGISVQSSNKTTTIKYSQISSPRPGGENKRQHLEDLQHDIAVIGEIVGKVHSLRGQYRFLDIKKVTNWYNDVKALYDRERELANMNWIELSLPVRDKDTGGRYLFNVHSPEKRMEWYAEFDNAKLRLTDNNNPGWYLQQDEESVGEAAVLRRTLPLVSKIMPLFVVHNKHKVECSLEVSVSTITKPLLWIFSGNDNVGMITVMEMNMASEPRVIESFIACQTGIRCAERVLEDGAYSLEPFIPNVSVWVGTKSGMVFVFDPNMEDRYPQLSVKLKSEVFSLKYCKERVFAGLANGFLACFRRKLDGVWDVLNPTVISLGVNNILCMTQAADYLWCGCGSKIFILNSYTLSIEKTFEIEDDKESSNEVNHLVAYGFGVWVSFDRSSKLHLYHSETLVQLQVISISTPVNRMKNDIAGRVEEFNTDKVQVTALMAKEGLLWVGTDQGLILTYPLPRLGGIPKVDGHASISFHAHEGAVKTLYAFRVQRGAKKCKTEQVDEMLYNREEEEIHDEFDFPVEPEEPDGQEYVPHYFLVEPEEIKEGRRMIFKEDANTNVEEMREKQEDTIPLEQAIETTRTPETPDKMSSIESEENLDDISPQKENEETINLGNKNVNNVQQSRVVEIKHRKESDTEAGIIQSEVANRKNDNTEKSRRHEEENENIEEKNKTEVSIELNQSAQDLTTNINKSEIEDKSHNLSFEEVLNLPTERHQAELIHQKQRNIEQADGMHKEDSNSKHSVIKQNSDEQNLISITNTNQMYVVKEQENENNYSTNSTSIGDGSQKCMENKRNDNKDRSSENKSNTIKQDNKGNIDIKNSINVNEKESSETRRTEKDLNEDIADRNKKSESIYEDDNLFVQENEVTIEKDYVVEQKNDVTIERNDVVDQKNDITIQGDNVVDLKNDVTIERNDVVDQKNDVTIERNDFVDQKNHIAIQGDNVVDQKNDVTIERNDVVDQKKDVTIERNDVVDQKNHITIQGDNVVDQKNDVTIERNDVVDQKNHITIQGDNVVDQKKDVTIERNDVVDQKNHITIQGDNVVDQKNDVTIERNDVVDQKNHITIQGDNVVDQKNDVTIQRDYIVSKYSDETNQNNDYPNQEDKKNLYETPPESLLHITPGYAKVKGKGQQNGAESFEDCISETEERIVRISDLEEDQKPMEAVYDKYSMMSLPNSPWHNKLDMLNYTPLEFSKSSCNSSVASSASGVGLKAYEQDLSFNQPESNNSESFYASLVTLSKRETAARKEALLKPWYVISIGAGHIDLRKRSIKENKTIEFLRSFSVISSSPSASHANRESMLVAWKIGNS